MNSEEVKHTKNQWNRWLDELAEHEYLVVDNFISEELYQKIQHYFYSLLEDSEFYKAGIGPAGQHQVEASIRGDFIYWLEKGKDVELSELFELLDELVLRLRRHLFLGISDYEFHFALYPPSTRYEKHIDQFRGKRNRLISVLIYLNEAWHPGDGGELKIYRPNCEPLLVEPIAKRLVMFKSDSVKHEVLLTHTERKSLTGWLLHQPSGIGYLV